MNAILILVSSYHHLLVSGHWEATDKISVEIFEADRVML